MTRDTPATHDLVCDVLRTLAEPYGEDVIEDVFVAIGGNDAWMARYRDLEQDRGHAVTNRMIGMHVKRLTGMETVRLVTAQRTGLITSYSKLRYPRSTAAEEQHRTTDLAGWLSEAWRDYQGTWAAVDQELYDLCRRRRHDSFVDVYTKVTFINRVYAAGINRSIAAVNGEDGETRVANALLSREAGVRLSVSRLTALNGLDRDAMRTIVREHARLTDALSERCGGVRPTSFVSKYLHFHCDLVPIYDSRAVAAISRVLEPYIPKYQRTEELLPQPTPSDPNYYWYAGRFLRLWELACETTPDLAIKMLDHALWEMG